MASSAPKGRRLVYMEELLPALPTAESHVPVASDASSYMKKCFRSDSVSMSQDHVASFDARTIGRFTLQAAARELLPREGVARCLRRTYPRPEGGEAVEVLYTPAQQAAHYGGLQICKSVWLCPVCAAKISERRRVELSEVLTRCATGEGTQVLRTILVTFTLAHNAGENLQTVLRALQKARRRLVSGREAKDFNEDYDIVGMIRSLELTHGDNGWHPHMHVLMFFDREPRILAFEEAIKARWSASVAAAGRYASWSHGCDVRFADADIAAYVAKFGRESHWTPAHELTKNTVKRGRQGGRTPAQLLADYVDGDKRSGRLWLEYASNLKGERQLWWSHGLRDRLQLEAEKTDEELATEESEIAVVLASLSVGAWRVVVANDARGELLEVAKSGDPERVNRFLLQLGVGQLISPEYVVGA